MLKERPKTCAECRYCRGPSAVSPSYICTYNTEQGGIDIVTGHPRVLGQNCYDARAYGAQCGPDGALWEQRAKPMMQEASAFHTKIPI